MAQKWEVGVGAGGGFYTSQDITNAGSSAEAKLKSNASFGAWLTNNTAGHWGGELRYTYQLGDLQQAAEGLRWIEKKLGRAAVDRLFDQAPRAILRGELPD